MRRSTPVPRQTTLWLTALSIAATVGVFAQTPAPPAGRAGGAQDPAGRGAGPAQPVGGGRGRRLFDPAAIERAKAVYTPNCAFCHGADARGGTKGPDPARPLLAS